MTAPESPVEAIFSAALAKRSPEGRAAYLDEACGGDPELRRRVEQLLEAHASLGTFLEGAAPDSAATSDGPPAHESPGTVIGPYKLLQPIGEGGMGTVYMAEQSEPVRRVVALKVIKPGMDTRRVIARFEAERQALAMMDHPNIARVLDAGTTSPSEGGAAGGGRPYFVMELVKGVPITRYCDERRLTPRQRLELYIPVCQAV
jgi:serine/threonine protein kinase